MRRPCRYSDEGKLIETPLHTLSEDAHRYRNSHKEIALIHVDSLGNLWLISQMKNHVFVFNPSGDISGYGTMESVVEKK